MVRAEMQCTDYLPVLYSTRDINMGSNGIACPLYNFDRTWKNGPDFDVFPPCTMKQDWEYEKEVLKQTMLKHEAIFVDQVSELHLLYRRQRELMDDLKRRHLLRHQMQPYVYSSQVDLELADMTVLSTKNLQASSSSKWSGLLSPESKKLGKRMLDLELPADVYIDSEEGEQLEDEKVSEVHEVSCFPLKSISETPYWNDSRLFPCDEGLPATFEGGFRTTNSLVSKGYDLVDLNRPIQVEEEETLSSILERISYVEHKLQSPTFSLPPLANQEPSKCTIFPRKCPQRNHNPHFENYPRSVSSCIRSSQQVVPLSYVAKSEPSSVASWRKPCGDLRHNPMAVQALPCFKSPTSLSGSAQLSAGNEGISPDKYHLNGNSADSLCVEGISALQNNLFLKSHPESMTLNVVTSLKANKEADCLTRKESGLSQAFPVFSSDFDLKRLGYNDCQNYENVFGDKPCIPSRYISTPSNSHPNRFEDKEINNSEKVGNLGNGSDPLLTDCGDDNKPSDVGSLIDLNTCITENESALIYSVPSSVTKRTIEIDLEAPVSPENKEVSPPRGESEEHQLEPSVQLPKQDYRDPDGELVRAAAEAIVSISATDVQLQVDNDCLLWFAGIVSALTGNLENDLKLLRHGMEQALRCKESNVEAYSCKVDESIVNRNGAVSFPSDQRKGRTRRLRQRKDIQTEFVSMNDAEGDVEIIGGSNGCSRGRRRARGRASISPRIEVEAWR